LRRAAETSHEGAQNSLGEFWAPSPFADDFAPAAIQEAKLETPLANRFWIESELRNSIARSA
jgi:hypothetical protein